MKPMEFWIVSGTGISKTHMLNAFDNALKECGLINQNLVYVSSIPPPKMIDVLIINGATWVPMEYTKDRIEPVSIKFENDKSYLRIPEQEIMYVIKSVSEGTSGEFISSGIGVAWYWIDVEHNVLGAVAMEEYGHLPESEMRELIADRLIEMLKARGVEPVLENNEPKMKIVTRSMTVPEDHFGVCAVFVVFNPYTMRY